ncbi:IclR family transcriptional regulator C-terminal domain-containing protein [Streptomyces sp. LX-29]|uniref:IclR family transcriptional regulator n=1 Tax=Streptomyces sp. LX-29 TaxID=2900152 RepID=UPI00240D7676|nr:IclR family transcriptional regulator C-terminal domain-containing protein [Streptomyces sp. LX-29]
MTTVISEQTLSGVGVLDKASLLLGVLEKGPASLSRLVSDTGLKRPTVHRLVLALERLRLLARDAQGRFILGPRLGVMAVQACQDRLVTVAEPVLSELRDRTGANARLYRRHGNVRVCVAEAQAYGSPAGHDRAAVGAAFPMSAGPASQVLLAWERPDELNAGLRGAQFTAAVLSGVRRQGWAQSIGGREHPGAAVAAPVRDPGGRVVAAVSISGPTTRLTTAPGRRYGGAVVDAAIRIAGGFVP